MDCDSDIPDFGAVFTFGRSRFSNNLPGKFWIRDDPVLQVVCGDEHTAILTASGRIFTFGNNEWGQLGHGHTNSLVKPSCVKGLRHERAIIIACGRSHTLVATDTGHVYGFGANSEGQLGSLNEYTIHTSPVRIQGLEGVRIKALCGGADHSIALTDKGIVYIWGSGSEGQLGLDRTLSITPAELRFETSVLCISAGYYHSAFVTVDGKLYTCGETEGGKLGLSDISTKCCKTPHLVATIPSKVVSVSCGGNHTIALTADGRAYSFGSGFNGQLGLGDRIVEAFSPYLVKFVNGNKVARVSCGENHTAFLTDTGHLYTCGDRRHGKLGLVDENQMCCSEFFPMLVERFTDFQVQQVACGGCHTIVLAGKQRKNNIPYDDVDIACPTRKKRSTEALPPVQSSPSSSGSKPQRNVGSVASLKNSTRARLPSITKSPVWYVPLEKTANGNQESDDEDEVLSKVEKRCSLLNALADESIRHADSDIDSDSSETIELNKTHVIVKIDDTISLDRPVISSSESDITFEKQSNGLPDGLQSEVESKQSEKAISENSESTEILHEENIMVPKKNKTKGKDVSQSKQSIPEALSRSHFYLDEDNISKKSKSSSTLSKSASCALI